jgi:hypothetical protein
MLVGGGGEPPGDGMLWVRGGGVTPSAGGMLLGAEGPASSASWSDGNDAPLSVLPVELDAAGVGGELVLGRAGLSGVWGGGGALGPQPLTTSDKSREQAAAGE